MSQDWDIKSRSETCAKCNRAFADGEEFTSLLTLGEGGYYRSDCCDACRGDASGALSTWKSVFKLPPPPPEEPLKKETAESLLRQFMAKDDFSRKNVIYILAVMLERRRILVERDVEIREDGTKIRVYEHKKSGESFVIPDPELKLGELEHVQQEVLELLMGKSGEEVDEPPA